MYLPGAVRYDGAALGFNAAVIAASGNLAGLIVPWRARIGFARATLLYNKVSAPAANISIGFQPYDFDGQTSLGGGAVWFNVLTAVPDDCVLEAEGTLAVVDTGTIVSPGIPVLLGAPYLQIRVINADAVNAVTVTLGAILTL